MHRSRPKIQNGCNFQVQGCTMISYLLEFAAIVGLAAFLYRHKAYLRRRNAKPWDSIVAQLQPDFSASLRNAQFLREEGRHATPQEMWQRVHGAYGLCAMYRNARIMMEMADYAARNGNKVDRELLATLRSDALHIRVRVAMALGQYAFSQVNERISANALTAASMYTEMAARTRQLLQANAGFAVPAYMGSMA
jgi:hypothetical protein